MQCPALLQLSGTNAVCGEPLVTEHPVKGVVEVVQDMSPLISYLFEYFRVRRWHSAREHGETVDAIPLLHDVAAGFYHVATVTGDSLHSSLCPPALLSI